MNPVLHKIIETKYEEVRLGKGKSLPSRKIPVRPWDSHLKTNSISVIAECKKGSPSSGILRPDYDPVQIASIYESAGAGAISVLTDSLYFFGSLSDLASVSESVSIPVIRKDFIIDPLQIDEAYAYGASAILLIVRILTPKELTSLHSFAKSLGLSVLVETHNKQEVKIALDSGATTIGINTRDLDTFEIHKNLIEEIAPELDDSIIRVAESGIESFSDWQKYKGIIDSMLVGTYFMKSNDIAKDFRSLLSGN
ncbi:indole-3-glycerol-phosphate synthase [Leptospira sp. 2 VSF19]|uniref:Indole-3-glycerol phosphate synthase n=1 Tax=Leptospira soteropolitanensis TaxID=2950025 RepID=A0AAW5VGW6_9LEPT|nr:indole-3-glycerol-phosphate synthase [Leptospira soteropolitanensis]MCW7494525.1 indole-3-glycerol-phosphate synthase [Leptospira soteropolitanensis]MCW7502119.1 indole-3-glycerol-phosphate synthase [Leptospira soteropolitanensis]MCW7524371.1 indole-3-glycerol-phosphate synthase [Leptospira soteropolitanensis]MCW7528237.1 indole-3-glycerol-phosphate synthase [Leptospira soteropolitanensis]MCW7532089.1 indole-3-glycerol-phosphate synthase [Leptospira soteropolitanensis]